MDVGQVEDDALDEGAKGSLYEVVSLLAMIGKRGCLKREAYQKFHEEADEVAAMLSGLIKSAVN